MNCPRLIYRAVAVFLALATVSKAATFTWDGGSATTNNWTDAINWSTNVAPPNDGSAQLDFGGIVRLTPNVDTPFNIAGLSFNATAGAFTIGGGALTIQGGGITNNDDSFQQLNNSITLGASQTWFSGVTNLNGSITLTSTINIGANTLTLDTANNSSIIMNNASVSGTGNIIKNNSGIWYFAGANANSYTGTTTVNAGTLDLQKSVANGSILGSLIIGDSSGSDSVRLDASNQISDTSAVTINSAGSLDTATFSDTIGALTLNGGAISGSGGVTLNGNVTATSSPGTAIINGGVAFGLGAATRTFTINDGPATTDLDIFATISGTGGMTKQGPGTLRFTGGSSNTYGGTTTVNDGTLVLAKSTAGQVAIAGPLIIGDGAGNDIVRLDSIGQINSASNVTINSSGLLDLNGNFQSFSSVITLNGGVITTGTAGTLRFTGSLTTLASSTTATIGGAGIIDLFGGTRTFTVNDGSVGDDLEIAPNIANGGLTKTGAGRLVFSGATANTYTGTTTVNDGTLLLRKTGGAIAILGPLTIGDSVGADVVRLGADEQIFDTSAVIVQSSGTFDLNSFDETITTLQLAGGTVTPNGGVLTLLGDLSTAGSASASIGIGTLALGAGTRTFTVIDGIPSIDLDISAAIINGSLIKAGPGTLQLSGGGALALTSTSVNTGTLLLNKTGGFKLAGGLIIGDNLGGANSDIVRYAASNQIASGAGNSITINSSGLLDLAGFSDTVSNIVFNGGAIGTGAGTLTINGGVTASANGSTATINGNVSLANSVVEFAVLDGAAAIDLDVPANVNQGVLLKSGLGTLRLSGTNNTLNSVLLSAGTLLVGGNLSVITLSLNGGTVQADGAPRTIPQVFLTGNSAVDGPTNLTFTTVFPNGGSLTKNGAGTLSITNPLTMSAPLTLNAGTVSANLTNASTFTQNEGTFSGSLLNQGTYTVNGGSINGTLTNEGVVNLNASLTVSGGLENRSTLNVGLGRTLGVNGTGLRNIGTLNLEGGALAGTVINDFGGQMNARGNIAAAFTNNGTLQTSGLLTVNGGAANFGVISIGSTQSLQTPGPFNNSGVITLASGSIGGSGTVANNAGGQIQGGGGVSATLDNLGGLIFANGASPLVITNFAGNHFGGELRVADGSVLNMVLSFPSDGTIQLQGPNATLNGGEISNHGTISGRGRISNTVTNFGVVRAEGGLLTFAGSFNNVSFASVQVPAGASIICSLGMVGNGGTISLNGGSFSTNNTPLSNSGIITGFGTFSTAASIFDPGLTNNGTITFTGGFTTVNGSVTNAAGHQIRVAYNPALFAGNVTNNGIFKNTSTTVTFAGTYTENGTFISDPADNFFSSVSIGEKGAWIGGVGDRFFVSGDLLNSSTNKIGWQTSEAELRFTGGIRHLLSIIGEDRGISFDGYDNNFAWGSLALDAADRLSLQGDGALYVRELNLAGGLAQVSSITGNGHNIYYHLSDPANAYLNGQTYALAGGGQIAPVPEPLSTPLLLISSILLLRRRHRE